ncbi:MAG: DUF5018 domain-containing protein [Rikenellaceae bacterium]|nr:DUF5018 domain-containing protein [Rikenellaceae bacterium]
MKKFFYLVAAVAMLFTACEFDPTDLNNRIDDLENRVTELEETIAALNQDIAGVETLVNAMQNNVYVSKIVKGENGYEVYFTNGEKIEIADGKAGEAGKDGVTVTVMLDEEDGQYYWAVIKDGVTSFIEVDGKRLPVKGEQGNTPKMRVVMEGETGYWEVSYDNGETWERVLLPDGTPVTTSGGAGGLFKEAYIDEDTNTAVFVFLNGEKMEIELRSDLYVNFKGEAVESADFRYGETKTFEMEAVGVVKAIVTTPDEWKASFDKETGVWTITAPSVEHALCADLEGEVALIYFGEENQSSVVTMNVSIGEFVEVAEENLVIEAEAAEATYDVPFTADGAVTVQPVDAWLSGSVVEGVAKITVAANTGAARTGTIKLVAKSNEVVITVNQAEGVELLEYGYRAGSETVIFTKPVAEMTGLTAANVSHIAVTNDYVIVSAACGNWDNPTNDAEAPIILDAKTGEYVGTLNMGDMAGAHCAVTADDAGNIVISSFKDATGGFRVARMKSITDTPEVFITRASTEYGKDISVVGDVYGDARIVLMYSAWSSGSTGNLLYQVSNGVVDGGYWSKITAGDTGVEIGGNNCDAIYRDMGEGAPCFVTGYSKNNIAWAEGGVAQYVQIPTNADGTVPNGNDALVGLDVEKFNNAYYLMAINAAYWWTPLWGVYMADVTTLDNFKAGLIHYNMGVYGGLEFINGNGAADCALRVSEDGVYMYAYALFSNNALTCIRVDCLKNAPEE